MKILVLLCVAFSVLAAACKSSPSTPTPPTPPAAATRVLRLGGNLNFGEVHFSTFPPPTGELTVSNDGTEVLQVSGIAYRATLPNSDANPNLPTSCLQMVQPLTPVSFAVPPGQTFHVGYRFSPFIDPTRGVVPSPTTGRLDCTGTITVTANLTSGTNTIGVVAIGF